MMNFGARPCGAVKTESNNISAARIARTFAGDPVRPFAR
jgi:hypothetical protein